MAEDALSMRTPLDSWFLQASYKLTDESAQQVWAEIREHYDSACDAAIAKGASPKEADRLAVEELGDPQAANRQYRKVLLTVADLKWLERWRRSEQKLTFADLWIPKNLDGLWIPFLFGLLFYDLNEKYWALGALCVMVGAFRPARWGTPWRIFKNRIVRWFILLATCAVLLQVGHFKVCVVICALAVYVEYRDDSLRRKLPMAQWPKVMRL